MGPQIWYPEIKETYKPEIVNKLIDDVICFMILQPSISHPNSLFKSEWIQEGAGRGENDYVSIRSVDFKMSSLQ